MIRELCQELEALQGVLQTLVESLGSLDVDLASLEQPLMRCKNACGEFNALIKRCTPHSTDEKASRRDWLRLRYMGEDISGFKNMLAGYNSTISIALAYANLQTTKTTQVVLEEYKDLIENTKCDLENHLHDIGMRLQNLGTQGFPGVHLQAAELQVMEDEKNSTQKSLEICEQCLSLIEQSRSQLLSADDHPSRLLHPTTSLASMNSRMARMSFLINSEGLVSAQKEVTSWKLKLLQHLIGIDVNIQGQQRCLPPGEEATLHPEE